MSVALNNSYQSNGLVLYSMEGGHPMYEGHLADFLNTEAGEFGAKISDKAIGRISKAVTDKIVDVKFAYVGSDLAGCAIVFPTAYPVWNNEAKEFRFNPGYYIEDFVISKAMSGSGLGTAFMRALVESAAVSYNGKDSFPAGAVICEQKWPGDAPAISRIMGKFNSTLATNPAATVVTFGCANLQPRDTSLEKVTVSELWLPLTEAIRERVQGIFPLTWKNGANGVQQMAATVSLGVGSFAGLEVAQVYIADNGNPPVNGNMKEALRAIFTVAADEAVEQGWIPKDTRLQNFRVQTNSTAIHDGLKGLGIDRKIGECISYPIFADLSKVPPSIGIDTSPVREFKPWSKDILARHPAMINGSSPMLPPARVPVVAAAEPWVD